MCGHWRRRQCLEFCALTMCVWTVGASPARPRLGGCSCVCCRFCCGSVPQRGGVSQKFYSEFFFYMFTCRWCPRWGCQTSESLNFLVEFDDFLYFCLRVCRCFPAHPLAHNFPCWESGGGVCMLHTFFGLSVHIIFVYMHIQALDPGLFPVLRYAATVVIGIMRV